MRGSRLAVAFLVAVVVASACGGSGGGSPSAAAKPNVTIGSTNFSEQLILGELYAMDDSLHRHQLKAPGQPVTGLLSFLYPPAPQ